MNNIVIIISCSADGGINITRMTKAEFLIRLKDSYWGKEPKFAPAGVVPDLDDFVGIIVIDGDIVRPKPKQAVTEYVL